ncbi:preprotein translocase subunit SecG [Deltaproteobacteria bacterium TL4]
MFTLILVLHVVVSIILIFFVLLQSGRGADLGAAFGSMGQVGFSRGQMGGIGILTTSAAVIFMLTSLTLAYMSSEKATESVVKGLKPVAAKVEPAPAPVEAVNVDAKPGEAALEKKALESEDTSATLPQTLAPPLPVESAPVESAPVQSVPAESAPENQKPLSPVETPPTPAP